MTLVSDLPDYVSCGDCRYSTPIGPDQSHVTCRRTGEWRTYDVGHGCCSGRYRKFAGSVIDLTRCVEADDAPGA